MLKNEKFSLKLFHGNEDTYLKDVKSKLSQISKNILNISIYRNILNKNLVFLYKTVSKRPKSTKKSLATQTFIEILKSIVYICILWKDVYKPFGCTVYGMVVENGFCIWTVFIRVNILYHTIRYYGDMYKHSFTMAVKLSINNFVLLTLICFKAMKLFSFRSYDTIEWSWCFIQCK